MSVRSLLRAFTAVALCVLLALPTFSQGLCCSGNIGPSNGQIAAGIVGAAAVGTGIGFLIYHETHKHPSITGCVVSSADGLTLNLSTGKKAYLLAGDLSSLKTGEQVTIKGKKMKDSTGKISFQVQKVTKDLGSCKS